MRDRRAGALVDRCGRDWCMTSGGCIDATYCSDRQRTLFYMIIFYDSSQIIFDEYSVDKFGDKWRIDSICKCFGIVDKWRTKKNSKHLFTITPETQRYSALHLSTIPL